MNVAGYLSISSNSTDRKVDYVLSSLLSKYVFWSCTRSFLFLEHVRIPLIVVLFVAKLSQPLIAKVKGKA